MPGNGIESHKFLALNLPARTQFSSRINGNNLLYTPRHLIWIFEAYCLNIHSTFLLEHGLPVKKQITFFVLVFSQASAEIKKESVLCFGSHNIGLCLCSQQW